MARNFNGGTDSIRYVTGGFSAIGTIVFRIKTTQVTANAAFLSCWSNSSRSGFGFILNSTGNANKIVMQGFDGSAARVGMASATTINDGNVHSVGLNWNRALGSTNTMYVDGASDVSAVVSGAAWTNTGSPPLSLGDNNDTFWASPVCDLEDVAICDNRHWTAEEHAAYGKGFSPKLISPNGLVRFIPLVRSTNDIRSGTAATVTGTTVSDHPRVMGGAV